MDQTGLPLPGATVQLINGAAVTATVTTGADGTFVIDTPLRGDVVIVSLSGFETARVPRTESDRIMLAIAHTAEATTVVAPLGEASSPTGSLLGNSLTAESVARLPSSHMKARESLPLLPSVVRGPDGLMQLGGARAHETPVILDGFNVTDPATGLSSINLPFEAVHGIDVLRDPMAVNYGRLLAGLVRIESLPGTDRFKMGVQGVVPRPRLSTPGFGRLEGIFPRVYASGSSPSGRLRYTTAFEYDYERISVPEVTRGRGPDLVEESATMFVRLDTKFNERHSTTFEALAFPSMTRSQGLSPRREQQATADLGSRDLFAGMTHRFVAGDASVLTVQVGALAHDTTLTPYGTGPAVLSPAGWRGNWFASATRKSVRYSAVVTWERLKRIAGRTHEFSLTSEAGWRRLRGYVSEMPILVEDAAGSVVRSVDFGPPSTIGARGGSTGAAFRDLWHASKPLEIDAGARVDVSDHGGVAPSARAGARYAFGESGLTVLKAGYGSFVGTVPLAVPAFAGYAERRDRRFDPLSGAQLTQITLQPTVGQLRMPRAVAATVGLERQLAPGLDAEIGFTNRRTTRLATLRVPLESGPLSVESTGTGHYREIQVSVRRTWPGNQQLFVSYVRSASDGELNDFTTLFQVLDAPLLQPGGRSRLASDAPHRVLAWGTFNLPRRVVLSPATEWRSGFLYSIVDQHYVYLGTPNGRAFPSFLATDLVVYKTVTVRKRSADLGVQIFNLTNHRNPRDVYAVADGPRFGQFSNSVGPVVRGYMLVKW